jgi:hypothetical protein
MAKTTEKTKTAPTAAEKPVKNRPQAVAELNDGVLSMEVPITPGLKDSSRMTMVVISGGWQPLKDADGNVVTDADGHELKYNLMVGHAKD